MRQNSRLILALLLLLLAIPAAAQQAPATSDPTLLTVDSILTFQTRSLGPVQWQENGSGYLALEPAPNHQGAVDIVRYDALSGERTIKVAADKLIPTGAQAPLVVEDFVFTPDEQKLLIFTNSARVWRSNTRGDYWVVDLASGSLRKLGGASAKPSTLMFAKFSPDGSRVGYVRENDIYVEELSALSANHESYHGRIALHRQRHIRLGLRRGVLLSRRFSLEPRQQAHRLLATQHRRRQRIQTHQQRRWSLSRDCVVPLPESRHDEFGCACWRSQRFRRLHALVRHRRRSAR